MENDKNKKTEIWEKQRKIMGKKNGIEREREGKINKKE